MAVYAVAIAVLFIAFSSYTEAVEVEMLLACNGTTFNISCENYKNSTNTTTDYRIEILTASFGVTFLGGECGGTVVEKCPKKNTTRELHKLCHHKKFCTNTSSNEFFDYPCPDDMEGAPFLDVKYFCRVLNEVEKTGKTKVNLTALWVVLGIICAILLIIGLVVLIGILMRVYEMKQQGEEGITLTKAWGSYRDSTRRSFRRGRQSLRNSFRRARGKRPNDPVDGTPQNGDMNGQHGDQVVQHSDRDSDRSSRYRTNAFGVSVPSRGKHDNENQMNVDHENKTRPRNDVEGQYNPGFEEDTHRYSPPHQKRPAGYDRSPGYGNDRAASSREVGYDRRSAHDRSPGYDKQAGDDRQDRCDRPVGYDRQAGYDTNHRQAGYDRSPGYERDRGYDEPNTYRQASRDTNDRSGVTPLGNSSQGDGDQYVVYDNKVSESFI